MKVAALLGLLAALPGHAADPVTPAQARANVVQALPPGIREGAEKGDLRAYLERLTPEQKQAALRSLTAKKDELGDDPKTQSIVGEAYVALGKVKEARQIAQAAIDRNANDPDARRLMGLVITQEKLQRPDSAGGAFGDRGGPGGGGASPAQVAGLTPFEQRIQSNFSRGQQSNEFRSTMRDAGGMSVAELKAHNIFFAEAPANQKDAIGMKAEKGAFTIYIRTDALDSAHGDRVARAAAHVAGGVRQVQQFRDSQDEGVVRWLTAKANGWISTAKTHFELARGGDLDPNPSSPSDQNLMVARKINDRQNYNYDGSKEKYGDPFTGVVMGQLNAKSKDEAKYSLQGLYEYFFLSTGRGNEGE